MNLFGPKPTHDPAVALRVKEWAREMGPGDGVMLTVMRLNSPNGSIYTPKN